jgi:hypothetical protein
MAFPVGSYERILYVYPILQFEGNGDFVLEGEGQLALVGIEVGFETTDGRETLPQLYHSVSYSE